ncbi:MAG: hypothetical protein L6Q71_08400, partial [Planctomycetes bacterium]|nr:hypothetical protein [Planctomycetota bacterium]
YACVKGRTQIISKQAASGAKIVLVASEPLTNDPGWHNVGLNKIMAIDADRSVISMSVKFEDPPAAAAG